MTNLFTAPSKNLYSKQQDRAEDPSDLRLRQRIEPVSEPFEVWLKSLNSGDVVILGYPDDRGVERNGGRTGAFGGPDLIRQQLIKMVLHKSFAGLGKIYDLGNLKTWSHDLLVAHEIARECIQEIQSKGAYLITLGGGHDWAFPDFASFSLRDSQKRARVLNIDAHLDMRPSPEQEDQRGHSGTPFRRIIELKNHPIPEFMVVGLQEHCNASHHVEWAQSRKVITVFLDEIPANLEKREKFLVDRLQLSREDSFYGLSVDLDAFPQFVSPGVSAPQVFGLDPRLVLRLMGYFKQDLKHLGIYEYNPNFDQDEKSARLAAQFIFNYLIQLSDKA